MNPSPLASRLETSGITRHRRLSRTLKHERGGYWDPVMCVRYRGLAEVCENQMAKIVPPTIADVLSCLLSDASSASCPLGRGTDKDSAIADLVRRVGYESHVTLVCTVTDDRA